MKTLLLATSIVLLCSSNTKGQKSITTDTTQKINMQNYYIKNAFPVEGIPVPPEYARQIFGDDIWSRIKNMIVLVVGCCCYYPPCECNNGGAPIVLGIDRGDVFKSTPSKKKTNSGYPLTTFYVKAGAKVRTPVLAFVNGNRLGKINVPKAIAQYSPTQVSQTNARAVPTIKQLIDAFRAGWAIGTLIDQVTGASDWLSDKFMEWFGPFGAKPK